MGDAPCHHGGRTIPAEQVGNRIRVDGKYIEFNVRTRDFATLNYRHTGVNSPDPDKNLPIGSAGTTIFVSKVPMAFQIIAP